MQFKVSFVALVAIAMAVGTLSRYLPDQPPVTLVGDLLGKRQDAATSTLEPPTSTLEADPWQCVTENITQYFVDVPQPTGDVLSGINSYGADVAAPCRATATGLDMFSCTVSDPKSWCGFTTAAPADMLSSYSTYVSAALSFWTAKSSTISILSTSCPVAWARPELAQHEWLKIAAAHANCYLDAHSETGTRTQSTGPSASASTTSPTSDLTSNGEAMSRGSSSLEALALMSTGLAVLVTAG